MSKSCCFAVVLAVICLSVILLSLEADAQPTTDETMTCGSSTLEEVVSVVKTIESNQQETAKDVKTLLGSASVEKNETCRLEDAVKEIKDKVRLLASNPIKCEYDSVEKQALVSALACEYRACFFCLSKAHKRGYYSDLTVIG